MNDLIKRDDLITRFESLQSKTGDLLVQLFWDGAISIIRQFPSAEITNDERSGTIMAEENSIVDAKIGRAHV